MIITHQLRQLVIPYTVIFPRTTPEPIPAHSNGNVMKRMKIHGLKPGGDYVYYLL